MKPTIFALTSMIFLAACGGGGSSQAGSGQADQKDSSNDASASSRQCVMANKKFSSNTAQAAGLYRGFLSVSEPKLNEEAFTLVSPLGRIVVLAETNQITGVFTDGYSVSGNVDLWREFKYSNNYDLDGVFSAGEEVNGYNLVGGDYEFSGQYQVSKEDVCLETVDASGSWSQQIKSVTTTITIDKDDGFTGSDSTGCVFDGAVDGFGINGGIASISATASNCSKSGNYSGVIAIAGTVEKPDTIIGAMWASSTLIPIALSR